MLESALRKPAQKRPLGRGAVLSLLAHAGVLACVVYLSSRPRATSDAPSRAVTFFSPAPPPPPPPPPAGAGRTTQKKAAKKPPRKPDVLVKSDKPIEPEATAKPEPTSDSVSATADPAGVSGGVEGGVVGGVKGGVVGNPLGNAGNTSSVLAFGAGMTRPSLVSKQEPAYPREALVAKVGGLMLVKCVITLQGDLRNCRIVKGLPFMDAPVLKALASWRYTPVLFQGRPVSVEYVIPVRLLPP